MHKNKAVAPVGITLAAMLLLGLGALWVIAPVWQPGFAPKTQELALLGQAQPTQQPVAEPINVNTATVQELTILPGVGQTRAQAILEYRAEHGPFASLDDMTQINGISARMVESWQGLAVAGPVE